MFAGTMMRALLMLVCLGVLEAGRTALRDPALISLPLNNVVVNGQQSFVGEMSVGTPAQQMQVVVDLNSRLSYVPSVKCEDPFCMSHKRYDASASSSYVEDGTPFELPYGQNASGVLSKDSIGVAGVVVQGQTFGEATAIWNTWSLLAPNDGVLGLGFGSSAPDGVTPLLDNMAAQGLISERVFGLWLGRDPAGGELTLGGLNSERHTGELAWESALLNPQGWALEAQSIAVGETSFCSEYCFVSVVTNIPYFVLSMEAAKSINDALGGIDVGQPGVAALDCTTLYKLPTLKMDIAGRTMEMDPLEYTFVLQLGGGVELCLSGFIGSEYPSGGYMGLGTLFLQKFYTAYDLENNRVGFADSVL